MNIHEAKMSTYQATGDALGEIGEGVARFGRGTMAGLVGGVIAAYVMNRYQEIEHRTRNAPAKTAGEDAGRQASGHPAATESILKEAAAAPTADPKVAVAQQVSRKLFEHDLSDAEKKVAAPAVHYGYGAAVGALYGGLSELVPTVGLGLGIPYATLVWLLGDEIAVPALGISKAPTLTPPADHVSALATHFVYGMTLDISRRILRRVL